MGVHGSEIVQVIRADLIRAEAQMELMLEALRPFAATCCVHYIQPTRPGKPSSPEECKYCRARAAIAFHKEQP
jgi:hypothetical protein